MSICLRTEETKKWNLLRLKNITSVFIRKQGMGINHGLQKLINRGKTEGNKKINYTFSGIL